MEYQTESRINKYFMIKESSLQVQTLDGFNFLNEFEREAFEERAAIIEYEGNLSKNMAEKLAYEIVLGQRMQLAKAS